MSASKLNLKFVLPAILLLGGIILFSSFQERTRSPQNNAIHISSKCRDTKSDRCYVKEFAQVARQNDLAYTLQTLSKLQKEDPSVTGCHFIAHVIASEEVNKNPGKWKELLKRIPIDGCTGGYLMGLMEGRSKFEKDFSVNSTTVQQICNEVKTASGGKDIDGTCFHVMGHLLLIETKGKLSQAVDMCSNLSGKFSYECHAGVFMENEYRRNLSAHGIGKSSKWNKDTMQQYKKICSDYNGLTSQACWREISHVFNVIYKNHPTDVYNACSQAPNAQSRDDCYIHAIGVMSISLQFDQKDFGLLCKPYEDEEITYTRCTNMAINTLKGSSSTSTALQKFCTVLPQEYKKLCTK